MAKTGSEQSAEEWGRFAQTMDAIENGPFTTDFERLLREGIELPAPESMTDAALTSKLWEMIEQLGRMAVVIERTDHLGDRELYAHLWHHSLREDVPDLNSEEEDGVWHVDILAGGSVEDNLVYLKYYADEETRAAWARDFPELEMPPREPLPHDRDRRLQQLYARLDAEEDNPDCG